MLLELAAANAAFAVVREALNNGQELAQCAGKLGEYFGLKADLAKKASSKGSDSEAFWAMESLREAESEREQEVRDKALAVYKRRQLVWSWINGILVGVAVLTGVIVIAGLVWLIVKRGI